MKLAFSTLGCPDWTFDEVLDRAQAMGYQAIELRGVNGKMRADEMDVFRPENRQATMEKIRAHGLTVCGFGSSASFHDPEKLAERMEVSRQSVSKWESGVSFPEMEKLLVLCDMFDTDLDTLLRGGRSKKRYGGYSPV